jgi:MOSC domain-containing protein YiiM
MANVLSVNVADRAGGVNGRTRRSGIDKRPVQGPVSVADPGPKAPGVGGGLAGDLVANGRHHGGSAQAVYAYARESLNFWEGRLARPLPCGFFGENLTTTDIDVDGARVGERWRVGDEIELQVTSPRIPCATFARWIGVPRWVRTFAHEGRPGAYLRVVRPGSVCPGAAIQIVHRPAHEVTVSLMLRALTGEPELLGLLAGAGDDLDDETREYVRRRQPVVLDEG